MYHIDDEASWVVGSVMSRSCEFDVLTINHQASRAPRSVNRRGISFRWRGRTGSVETGINNQLRVAPLKIAPVVKKTIGVVRRESVLESW